MSLEDERQSLIADAIAAGATVKRRLIESLSMVRPLLPFTAEKLEALDRTGQLETDALLLRFSNMVAIAQDQLIPAILRAEEEKVEGRSRLDHRNTAEKIGALPEGYDYRRMADARNQVAHQYPHDPARQAEILNSVTNAAETALAAYDGLAAYASRRFPPVSKG